MTEHHTFEVPPGEDILHGLTETSPELDGLRIDMPPVVVLFIDNTDSRCGACGKTALPQDVAHTTPCGYDNHDGCGATFTHVSSNYGGDDSKRASMAVRRDLPWMDYGEAHKHDGARKPRAAAPAAEQTPTLSLPDGWERVDGPGGLYCRLLAGDGLVVYADATGVLFAGRTSIEYQPGAARTLAARLIEGAGIVEQLQRGAR